VLTLALLPFRAVDLVRWLANVWSLGLIVAAAATLAWFVYSIFLKRLLRVRRIANIRLRRILDESAHSDRDQAS
jgi:hypothetical protein